MLSNIKLQYKLIFLFLVMAVIVAVTGCFGLWSHSQISALLEQNKSSAAQEKLAVLMKVALQGSRVNLLEAAMTRDNADDFENSKVDYELKRDTFDSYCSILIKGEPRLHILPAPPGSLLEQRIGKVREAFAGLDKVAQQLLTRKAALMAGAAEDGTLDHLVRSDLPQVIDAASVTVNDLLVEFGHLAAQRDAAARDIQHRSTVIFLSVIVGAILLAIILGLLATRSIVIRIRVLAQALNQGAEGDLTATVQDASADELGRLGGDFNLMLGKLSSMMAKVKRSGGELSQVGNQILDVSREVIASAEVQQNGIDETSAAVIRINESQQGISGAVETLARSSADTSTAISNMAGNIRDVASNTDHLAASVGKVSSSISEMDTTIKQIEQNAGTLKQAALTAASSIEEMDFSIQEVEQNAQLTAEITEAVHRDAETGQQAVQATIAGIQEIRRSGQLSADSIDTLAKSVNDIGLVLSVINDVTEETRLLSLNASIIAAQSGEHGKGFAVVADEIRKLAERTAESTREIDQLITRVEEETRRAVEAIAGAEKKIGEGEQLSQQSGAALVEIVAGVERSTVQVNGIARATREQSKGSQLIRETMEKVSDMVGQIAVATHQQARASEQIMAEVEKMSNLTAQVRSATQTQNADNSQISRLTEEIGNLVEQIRQACGEQAAGSGRIVEAVADIQASTRQNLSSAKVMGGTLGDLSLQIGTLEKEVATFKVLA